MKKKFEEFKNFIKHKNVAVVGIGVSNIPLIHFLLSLEADVSAFDKKSEEVLGQTAIDFKSKGVKLILGENYLDNLSGFDVIFKTPSMRSDSKALIEAKLKGAYITSEMEEFLKYCPCKVYGITGSDGKTTTTTIVYNMLKEQGFKTWVGGNIGFPLFANIEEIEIDHRVVLELSSFQLMTMENSPQVSLVTNLSPNHLDMHKDMEEYIDCKKNIFKHQEANDLLILNKDNDITRSFESEAKGNVVFFTTKSILSNGAYYSDNGLYVNEQKVCNKDEILINGMHNVENFLGAFCCVAGEVSVENMKKIATTFTGVEHRCEFVRELDGVKYYNGSIASSPTRTVADLKSFEKPVVLIAGGYDKNLPFDVLAEEGYSNIKGLILIGNTKYKIKEAFEKVLKDKPVNIPIILTDSLENAVLKAREISLVGDVVTLSPACASFDMFVNFEVRGNTYKEIVNSLD
jgi:UDP-N-acetylmuramoylalanine--D-glutamate ligase